VPWFAGWMWHKDSTYATILDSQGRMVDSKLYEIAETFFGLAIYAE
jgi:hypothetical protein